MNKHEFYMREALKEAKKAFDNDEVPVGAIVLHKGEIIARAHNQIKLLKDPTAHAEIIAITQAANFLQNERLTDCVMYSTLEPCSMCAGAMVLSRIKSLIYASKDPKTGAHNSVFKILSNKKLNHRVKVRSGVMELQSSCLMKEFFKTKRIKPFLLAIMLVFLLKADTCLAEKIHCKDGRVLYGEVLYRTKTSLWIKQYSGAVGINFDNIDRIEDDSGGISKYDNRTIYNIIQGYISDRKYSEAVNLCALFLKYFPENTRVRYLRAVLNHELGSVELAVEDYNFLIERGMADAEVFNNMGVLYASGERYKEAEEMFLRAIKYDEKMIEAHNNLAEIFLQINDNTRAIKEYNEVIKIEPDNIKALYNSGIAYARNKEYKKARECWEKVLSVNSYERDAKEAIAYLDKFVLNQ